MPKPKSLASMSVDALIELRDNIGAALSTRAGDLQRQLASLTGMGKPTRGRPKGSSGLKGTKVKAKYRGPDGTTWPDVAQLRAGSSKRSKVAQRKRTS